MSTPFMGELRIMSFNFAPKGWSTCNGQFLSINQNQALFSLFGTMYGGNGQTTFALPNLQGLVPVGVGGGSFQTQGQKQGEVAHTVTSSEMPQHNHAVTAKNAKPDALGGNLPGTNKVLAQGLAAATGTPGVNIFGANPSIAMGATSMANAGGSQQHQNMQPYLTLNICVALQGIYPTRT